MTGGGQWGNDTPHRLYFRFTLPLQVSFEVPVESVRVAIGSRGGVAAADGLFPKISVINIGPNREGAYVWDCDISL